ncbi:DUF6493 family protein [Chryseobacterium sp. JV558]|uniref:DUF7825 domain-containing protein n=1 Tax=Chryseobacterium sp. JV558 TaxID=2663236 RepID=UPI00299E634C|nr:DUF6493 family protein [Chryseobacterium sp. JV558]MDW9382290.1 hypothetical protein [Chryseobacterium sp. JV558]
MLIDEGFKAIYLNYKIKEIVPFLKKLTPKDKEEIAALLKKHRNKKLSRNTISVLASLICCKAGNEYKDKSGYDAIPACFVDGFSEKYPPENTSFLNILFNSYYSVYHNRLMRILFQRLCFSGSFFSMGKNKILLSSVYQYSVEDEVVFPDVWMKIDLPSPQMHYLFLSSGLFNKYETLSGTAFEALLNKAVSDDFKVKELEIIINKKTSFEWTSVKRFTDRILKRINLITSCDITFRKLLITILSAVGKSVFNVKKPLELCNGL